MAEQNTTARQAAAGPPRAQQHLQELTTEMSTVGRQAQKARGTVAAGDGRSTFGKLLRGGKARQARKHLSDLEEKFFPAMRERLREVEQKIYRCAVAGFCGP